MNFHELTAKELLRLLISSSDDDCDDSDQNSDENQNHTHCCDNVHSKEI